MIVFLVFTLCVGGALGGGTHNHHATTTTPAPKTDHELNQDLLKEIADLKTKVDYMSTSNSDLTRQVMLNQLFVEERIRTDGSSGVKQVRSQNDGTRPYYVPSTGNTGVAGLHEHANNARTVGMGELNAVLNGIEFRTRHNDYSLVMPSTSKVYDQTVDVPFPDVPPQVLAKHTIQEQILEMREWFKAFKNQDHSVRDYRKYFKPVLTYLEGGWTTNTKTLEEPFASDRHHIDASSWFDLQDKVRFTSYSGEKSVLENYAYLPTTIINVINGTPEYAQWNYRIVVHPLKDDLPLKVFMPIDDLAQRLKYKKTMEEHLWTRGCRFALKSGISYSASQERRMNDTSYRWALLDDLMYQIPGKDNYHGAIYTNSMGQNVTNIRKKTQPYEPLNIARYHRWYRIEEKDAMGTKFVHRGFSDSNLFVAETTNPKISGLSMTNCKRHFNHHTQHNWEGCKTFTERVTYAVPLEIIYMTPLLSWNPYNITYAGLNSHDVLSGPNGNRNGQTTVDKAFNGTYRRAYYRTPAEFYHTSGSVDRDQADTAKGVAGVLDQQGVVRKCAASGTRIIQPDIEGVGKIRIRYPIMPFHAEGENTRKELEALKDMVMQMTKYSSLYETSPTNVELAKQAALDKEVTLKIRPTTHDPPGLHGHDITLHQSDIEDMQHGHIVRGLLTSIDNGHQHSVDVALNGTTYRMLSCDGMTHCWDGHPTALILET